MSRADRRAVPTLGPYTSRCLVLALLVALIIIAAGPHDVRAQSLPSGWADQDIGAVGVPGSATYNSGTFTVKGSGADIWNTADAFNFANLPLPTDGWIMAHVASIQNTDSAAKAGVMIRETLTATSTNAILDMKPNGAVEFMARTTTGASTSYVAGGTGSWLKLVRSKGVFIAYISTDGATWTSIGSQAVTMATTAWIGLVVCSHNNSVLNTSVFDHVTVSTDAPPTVAITGPANAAAFTAGSSVTITATASDADATPVANVAFYANNTLLGTATSSPYTFTWTNVAAGTYALTAVATDTANQATTSNPVSITVSSSSGTTTPTVSIDNLTGAVAFATGSNIPISVRAFEAATGIAKVDLYANNGTTNSLIGTVKPLWVPYTFTWTNVAAGSYSVTAVATDGAGQSATSTAVQITVSSSGGTGAPTVSITSPTTGTTFTFGSNIDFTVSATDADTTPVAKVDLYLTDGTNTYWFGPLTAAPYIFSWPSAPGSYTFTAIATDTAGNATISAPVSITVQSDAAPTVAIASPTGGTFPAGGSITITANASDADTTPVKEVDFYAKNGTSNARIGTVLASPYTFTWANVPAGVYSLTAVATDTANNSATSAAVGITVATVSGSTDTPPTVSLNLAAGAQYMAGASISVSASASDPDSTPVAQVAFYENNGSGNVAIGISTTSPYTVTWPNVPLGNYSLTAVATDTAGNSTTSAPVSISVVTDVPPTAYIASPSGGAAFAPGASVSITAHTTDKDTTPPAQVAFYANNSLLGTAQPAYVYGYCYSYLTRSYYRCVSTYEQATFTWPNVPAGWYTLTAVATDTAGYSTTSAPVTIAVSNIPVGGVPLPSPWVDQDIGTVGVTGNASGSNGAFTLEGAGADIWGTADSFNFADVQLSTDTQIVARVASIQNTDVSAKAGVMFRETTDPGSKNVILDMKPDGTVEFLARSTTGGSTAYIAGGIGNWLKLVRAGNVFTAYVSTDGAAWTPIGSTSVSMSAGVSIGLAVCSHNATKLNTSMFDNVIVQ